MRRIKKIVTTAVLAILSTTLFIGCNPKEDSSQKNYDGRTFYEIFVRSFKDSDGDGVGDLQGVIEKLDYLEDLGVNGIWLMPINQSMSYHGYDIDDYYAIDEEYGTMDDFKELLKEAKKRDIKIVMDLVINHTSINNEWFVDARTGEDSKYRDYYIWSDDMTLLNEVSPMNTLPWTKNGNKEEVYYSIFWGGMPDLNFDNPKVFEEIKKIVDFYLDIGVDGFRLDAAKWIYNDTEKNAEFWGEFNDYVKSVNKDAITVGEVWDSPYNTIYYTNSLDSFFEFSIGEYIVSRINGQSISGFVNDYNLVDEMYEEENEDFVMATFLTNHDQNRVRGSFRNDFQMKVAAAMYLTLPGTPFIYYGEEIGMLGSGKDENKRQPFIWSNTDLSENTNWEEVTFDISNIAVDVQEKDEESLLNLYKGIIKARNKYKSLRYGEVNSIDTSDNNILAMERTFEKEKAYVLINGNSEDGTCDVPKGKYKVVYSNTNRDDKINSEGSIEINKEEIMIIVK